MMYREINTQIYYGKQNEAIHNVLLDFLCAINNHNNRYSCVYR